MLKKLLSLKWEMLLLVISALNTSTQALPIPPQHKDVVGAYYYPWYFPGKWADLQTQLTPTLGLYNTDSMPIVVQHIDSAAYYGVDVFFMSWWKKTDVTDTHLRNGFMKAPNNNKIKFAMVVEPLGELDTLDGKRDGIVDFNSPLVVKGWLDIFEYFKTAFFSHPSYYKVGGKPVVLVYVTRTFLNFGPQYLDSLKAKVGDVYIMADEAFIGAQSDPVTARNGWRNRSSVFPSYVSYNSYEAALIQPKDSAITYQRRVAMPYYQNWAAKTVFHPPLLPYYQDFRPGHPPLPGTEAQFRDIIKEIKALPMAEPASDSLNRIYMVTSWNEWFEGTSIEPSLERGINYCKVLREAFVEQGIHSRSEPVKMIKETPVRIKSVSKGTYLCLEKAGAGNVSIRSVCPLSGRPLVLVELGNDEVALQDPLTGKYLSLYSDGLLYPIQSYIGTWEIFKMVHQGVNVALQSKKNGAWLKPLLDATSSLVASNKTLDADGFFQIETGTAGIIKNLYQDGFGPPRLKPAYVLSYSANQIRVSTQDRQPITLSLMDMQGTQIRSQAFEGGGTYAMNNIPPGSLGILVIKGQGLYMKEIVSRE
jgi:hypothetical protein